MDKKYFDKPLLWTTPFIKIAGEKRERKISAEFAENGKLTKVINLCG